MDTVEVKRAFVEPTLTEEASLEDVTLMSGGVNFGHPKFKRPKHGGGGGGGANQQGQHGGGHGNSGRHS